MKPGSRPLVALVGVLLVASIGIQVVRDRGAEPYEPVSRLWVESGPLLKRLSLGFESIVADIYWMRAVVYYGGQRRAGTANFDLLDPLLTLVTTLDPRFTVAYRFGAIFLTEGYPNGPGRPDQAVALLQRGAEHDGNRWEYLHDIGFVYYWWLHDYPQAASWFEKAGQSEGAPSWLAPLAATTLAVGGDRQSSRTLWSQLRESSDVDWIRTNAEHRLRQLDAMDVLDQLNAIAARFAAREGRPAATWAELVRAERLRGVPLDPTGTPYDLDGTTGRIGLARDSALWPLPTEPAVPPAQAPPS